MAKGKGQTTTRREAMKGGVLALAATATMVPLATPPTSRATIEEAIEHAIAYLDLLDGDPDLEDNGDREDNGDAEDHCWGNPLGESRVGDAR